MVKIKLDSRNEEKKLPQKKGEASATEFINIDPKKCSSLEELFENLYQKFNIPNAKQDLYLLMKKSNGFFINSFIEISIYLYMSD